MSCLNEAHMGKKTATVDLSTEDKIKEAARKVFTSKGYAATRTRDIAEEAGINLALLNYYFRSKEKLFEIIMAEKMFKLFSVLAPVIDDPKTTLEKKVETIVVNYIDLLRENPDLPLFVLSEIRTNPQLFSEQLRVGPLLQNSALVKQLKEKRPDLNPLHFVISLLGMTVFPFIMKPVVFDTMPNNAKVFDTLVQERKKLIPSWIKAILKAK